MLSFDVIIFHGQQMLSFLCYNFPLYIFCVIIYVFIWCYHLLLSFPPFFLFPENVTYFVLSFMLSLLGCYHLCYHLMLSFLTGSKCYRFYVIISPCTYFVLSFLGCYHLCYHLMLSFFTVSKCYHFLMLSFPLVHILCYHVCYHLMLSFIVIISPLFSFSWKRDTLKERGGVQRESLKLKEGKKILFFLQGKAWL